ncbi:hypothetical protein, partial [Rhodoblastus sp.]
RQNNELETSSDSEATEKALKLPASLLSGAGREIVRLLLFEFCKNFTKQARFRRSVAPAS